MNNAIDITVLQLPKFKIEATELFGTEGIEAIAAYLAHHPEAGAVIPGTGGKGQREARRRPDHLCVRDDRCADLPTSLLRQERQDRSDK